jgi:hypothetical protein
MLDLITNFLALTYNKAEFWGGGIRYFQKTGYIIPGLGSKKFEDADFIGGIKESLEAMVKLVQEEAKKLAETVGSTFSGIAEGDLDQIAGSLTKSKALQNAAGNWIKELLQKPLSIRSFLDGRATGEWHLTVGNPLNPLAVIGNLCLKTIKINFSDTLGADDFPTEVKFTLTLDHGRPRAKQDIESMFNLGGGDMSFTAMPPPSSAFNSLGERNSVVLNNFQKGRNDTSPQALTDERAKGSNSATFVAQQGVELSDTDALTKSPFKSVEDISGYFKVNVARAYGVKWAKSPAIPDYFVNLKTKD